MSSPNYRILMHFLTTLNDSIQVVAGLRGHSPQLLNRIGKTLFEQNQKNFKLYQNDTKQLMDLIKKANPTMLAQDAALVAEGLRQYTEYVVKHSSANLQIPLLRPLTNNLPNRSDRNQMMQSDLKIQSFKPLEAYQRIEMPNQQQQSNLPHAKPVISPPKITQSVKPKNNKSDTNSKVMKPRKSLNESNMMKLSEKSRERKVPANRLSRVLSFGSLALSMGMGAVGEFAKRSVSGDDLNDSSKTLISSNLFLTKSNAEKIVDTLCQVRGAALKLGQMLSIQDNDLLGPEIQSIFERVRQSADYMPEKQLKSMLISELGNDWRSMFKEFEMKPFAAASIGQVHLGKITTDDNQGEQKVAIKVQYPGVAESIESDIKNVLTIIKYANIFPEGLFLDHVMNYAKIELSWEVDYRREAECQVKYGELVEKFAEPGDNFYVPKVYRKLSTKKILTTELIHGIPIDKLDQFIETSDQRVKNSVCERILKLFFYELLLFNYMQTDPNWSNFFYNHQNDQLSLIDFGNCRTFSQHFIRNYIEIINAAIDNDRQEILNKSMEIGFLTGYEQDIFKNTHTDSVLILGEALRFDGEFDFGNQSIIKRIQNQLPIMLKYRLKPPPEEIYSLHRKLSGLFLLCCKLDAKINCRHIYDSVLRRMYELNEQQQQQQQEHE